MSRAADFREKILKEGALKHRQSSIALPRWKPRYVVFKITGGGRLQFIIYKDMPTSPTNEIKEIPIEEFGGLESSIKMDSEKHVFCIITTSATDCFSTDCAEDLKDWSCVLQEYLGKELTFNITIPYKQAHLKSGKGVLRIRNTGFTITTCDSPPRCLGTWQIIHIRKFGGTDSFRFQTGSKCPTGEYMYSIQTDDNAKVKSLFSELSQHKPIFSDDRVGRRMTLERNFNQHWSHINNTPEGRLSLHSMPGQEPDKDGIEALRSNYENSQFITEIARSMLMNARDTPPPLPPNRPVVDSSYVPHSQTLTSTSHTLPLPGPSEERPMYQNVSISHSGPNSPTKRPSRYPPPNTEPLPEGYYNVSPPLMLRKINVPNKSSSSSPDSDSSACEFTPVPPPPVTSLQSTSRESVDGVFLFGTQHSLKREGEKAAMMAQKNGSSRGGELRKGYSSSALNREEGMYQNVDVISERPNVNSFQVPGPTHTTPTICDGETETMHNYTNVDFALESARRKPPPSCSPRKMSRTVGVTRNVSAPPLSRSRSGAISFTTPIPTPPNAATPPPSSQKLNSSHSSYELGWSGRQPYKHTTVPEYYNLFVSAGNSKQHQMQPLFKYANPATVSSWPAIASSHRSDERGLLEVEFAKRPTFFRQSSNYSSTESNFSRPVNGTLHEEVPQPRATVSHYDRLEPRSTPGTPRFSPVPSASPESLSRDSTPRPAVYDQLTLRDSSVSSETINRQFEFTGNSETPSPVPEPSNHTKCVLPPMTCYERKMQVVGHGHNYEYIDMAEQNSSGSVVPGPSVPHPSHYGCEVERSTGVTANEEHPSEWFIGHLEHKKSISHHSPPSSQPRRTPLPLQTIPLDESFTGGGGSLRRKTEQKVDRLPNKARMPLTSTGSEFLSSGESDGKLQSPLTPRRPASPPEHTNTEALMTGQTTAAKFTSTNKSPEGSLSTQQSPKIPLPKQFKQRGENSPTSSLDGRPISELCKPQSSPPLPPKLHKLNSKEPHPASSPPFPNNHHPPAPGNHHNFKSDKPLVPPKPRHLSQKPVASHYAAMNFPQIENDGGIYTEVQPRLQKNAVLPAASWDSDRVIYRTIDFEVTEGLRRTKLAVENQRNLEIQWIEQERLKTIAASAK